ncbi:DNA-methyltransferase [Lysinibacillus sp. NPDC097162]|uniref:DNA-methyltransferase n=1 Tax=Lysinibacillus sp. NPDC097162 TaxID=3364140 RepID=UPI003815D470
MRGLPAASIDLTVTSPPYDDLRTYNGYRFDFESVANELFRITKPGGIVVWVVGDKTDKGSETLTSFKQALYFKEIGFNMHDTMIWRKMSPFQHKNRYIADFEYMFVLSKGKPKVANLIRDRKNKHAGTKVHGTLRQPDGSFKEPVGKRLGRTIKEYGARTNVWEIPAESTNRTGHPAVFPERLAHDHILSWSDPGDIVFDCFAGSGTTLKMALMSDRRYLGVDVSEEYVEIARQRIIDAKQTLEETE